MTCSIVVGFVLNAKLIQHMRPIVKSVLKHTTLPVHVCVLTDECDNVSPIQDTLHELIPSSQVHVKAITDEDKRDMQVAYWAEQRTDITYVTFAQLYFPHYFSQFEKILCLEPDQIVQKSLDSFWQWIWDEDIKLAAVPSNAGESTLRTLQIIRPHVTTTTYNAGVVVVDTKHWIDNNWTKLCMDKCREQKAQQGKLYEFYSEGCMNITLNKHFTPLHLKYNYMGLGWETHHTDEAISQAVILHWNGGRKPWLEDGYYRKYYLA